MMLDNMNELNLIEYLQTFNMIDVNHESLIGKHPLYYIFYFFSIETILVFDPYSHSESTLCGFINLDIYLLYLEFVIFEFDSRWTIMIADITHDVLRLHKHCISFAADVSENYLDSLLVHHSQCRDFNKDLS